MATGLEAAATLISIIGFSAQAFDGCVKAFVLLSTARNLGKDADVLRCMIDWEQLRLVQWAEKVNLHHPRNSDKSIDWRLVQTTLGHLKDLLGDVRVLKARYGLILEDDIESVDSGEKLIVGDNKKNSTSDRFRNLFVHQGTADPASPSLSSKVINSKNSVAKRLRWAAIDKRSLELLLSDISHLTQRLYDTTNAAVQAQILSSVTTLLKEAASWSQSSPDLQLVKDLARQTPQVQDIEIQPSLQKRYDKLLLQAVHDNDILRTESLIDEGASANALDQVGWPALVHSAQDGKLQMCEMLLRRGADPTLTTTSQMGKRLPQHFAAEAGQVEVLRLLLGQEGVTASTHDYLDLTALHYAAKACSDTCVKLLLEQEGIEVDNEDRDGRTPLMWALGGASLGRENATSIIRRLLAFPEVNPNQTLRGHGQSPLWMAVVIIDTVVMEMLLVRPDLDINQRAREGETAVYRATRWHKHEILQMLLAKGVDVNIPNGEGRTPLSVAAMEGNESGMRLLLDRVGIERDRPELCGKNPLIHAAQAGHVKCVRLLLESGVNPHFTDETNGTTALSYAAAKGHKVVVRALLKAGSFIDHQDNHGNTPLAVAVVKENTSVVRLLLDSKADPYRADEDDETPLDKARDMKSKEILAIFQEVLKI
ncbi:MAG: hypothetical protein Q9218_004751 [Villophora microphyllina]